MRKLILCFSVMIGLLVPFAGAHASAPDTDTPVQPIEINVIAAAPSPGLQQLHNEVQVLQTQIQALRTQAQVAGAVNLAEVENLPSGG